MISTREASVVPQGTSPSWCGETAARLAVLSTRPAACRHTSASTLRQVRGAASCVGCINASVTFMASTLWSDVLQLILLSILFPTELRLNRCRIASMLFVLFAHEQCCRAHYATCVIHDDCCCQLLHCPTSCCMSGQHSLCAACACHRALQATSWAWIGPNRSSQRPTQRLPPPPQPQLCPPLATPQTLPRSRPHPLHPHNPSHHQPAPGANSKASRATGGRCHNSNSPSNSNSSSSSPTTHPSDLPSRSKHLQSTL